VVWYDGDVVVGGGIIQKDLKFDGISFPAPGAAAGQPLLSR